MGHELVKPKQLKMRRKWFKKFARYMITRNGIIIIFFDARSIISSSILIQY